MIGLIQIPSTSEAVDARGVYTVFNIHVNGCYHGSFRYSQMFVFHHELKDSTFDTSGLDEFPGKHWFGSLSAEQLLARRIGLERYLHSVCQDRVIGVSSLLKEFLIAIQKASLELSEPSESVQVFLVNGKSVSVALDRFDRTDQVLERVCSQIELGPHFTYYFGLFLEKESSGEDSTWTVSRSLTDFECPLLTLTTINKTCPHRISIRKNFWDPVFIPELCDDRVAKNLLYIEALASVKSAEWEISDDVRKQLSALQRKGHKKEYLELTGGLVQYGFIQLDGLTFDHPTEDMAGFVRVGKLDIVSYVRDDEDGVKKVFTYPLTRIRSWKLGGKPGSPWLKFFFQAGPGDFVPVHVTGLHTILMSHCLHSIVDELLRVRAKQPIRHPHNQPISRELRELPQLVFHDPPELAHLPEVPEGGPDEGGTDDTDSITSGTTPDTPTSPANPTPTTDRPHPPEAARMTSVTSASSTGEPDHKTKVKTPKKKLGFSSDVENPTFAFGTDDDL